MTIMQKIAQAMQEVLTQGHVNVAHPTPTHPPHAPPLSGKGEGGQGGEGSPEKGR